MASYVLSQKIILHRPPPPPSINNASLFRKCHISLNKTHNLIPSTCLTSNSMKCKTAAQFVDLSEPLTEAHDQANNHENSIVSDVEKKPKHRPFWRRKWVPLDVLRLGLYCMVHAMFFYAPFCFSWHLVTAMVSIGLVTGVLGIILSYHRHLSHKSFTLPKWLEYIFAYCGVLAFEGNPIDWVSNHRHHHMYADTARDPHSPIEGFWFSYISWILDRHHLTSKNGPQNNVDDLRSQAFYRFLEKTYYFHPLGFGALLYAIGGLPLLVWGLGVRTVIVLHITALGTSVIHLWGDQPYNTGDSSRNNWWVALLTFGDGWHNNHHAFQYSARAGLEWWQVDVTWGIIRVLEALGLATDVKLPTKVHMERMARRRPMDKLSMQS